MLCQDLYFSLALTLCRYASFFFLVFNFINVQEILELFRSAPYSTSTATHRSKITDQSWGGAIFLEQLLTSGGNPFVKENEQQVINNKWNERVGER